ncbi:MAG: AAA family ATPase [Promethearchaeota archaeon]
MDDFFQAIKKYEKIAEQLKKTKLAPNLTVLLYGPPGTGKTSLTRAFSKQYSIPLCVVESDRLVSPLLGDTIKNIRNVVELAADIAKKNSCFLLFFDEIDAIGSERSNIHEVGEIKRAVISFLQVIDKVNYDGVPLAIFGATNHQQQLDSAIWRRFTFHLKFDFPDYHLRKSIIEAFINKIRKAKIGVDNSILDKLNREEKLFEDISSSLKKKIGRDISEFDGLFFNELQKKGDDGLLESTIGYSGSDIERGTQVALFKTFTTELLTYEIFSSSLKLVGGTAIHVRRQEELAKDVEEGNASAPSKKNRRSTPPEI